MLIFEGSWGWAAKGSHLKCLPSVTVPYLIRPKLDSNTYMYMYIYYGYSDNIYYHSGHLDTVPTLAGATSVFIISFFKPLRV